MYFEVYAQISDYLHRIITVHDADSVNLPVRQMLMLTCFAPSYFLYKKNTRVGQSSST